MSLASLQALYAEGLRLFQEGRLEACREVVEDLLLSISRTPARAGDGRSAESLSSSTASGASPASSFVSHHELFANGLLMLSNCYSAVGDFAEAERLLATCQGYLEENAAPHVRDGRELSSNSNPASAAAFTDALLPQARVNIALAALAQSRAALRLEQYRTDATTAVSAVREADEVYLAEAERRLTDVLGADRLLLADVWHCRGVCCELLAEERGTDGGAPAATGELPRASASDAEALPYLRALTYYSRSMDVRSRYTDPCGTTELKLALTMEHVAHVLRLSAGVGEHEKRQEALQLLETVAETRHQWLGPRHPLVASTLLAVGALSVEMGRYKRAKRCFEAALVGVKEAYPLDDVRVAEVEYWLARVS